MERGSRRPDPPATAHAAVRTAAAHAACRAPKLKLFARGKSFGGRMPSQAQAIAPLAEVRGLVFLGFPLHPAGKPGSERATHLSDVKLPMLFLGGTRDALAEVRLLKPVVTRLGKRATLKLVADADHSSLVPVRSGRSDGEVLDEILDTAAGWMISATPPRRSRA